MHTHTMVLEQILLLDSKVVKFTLMRLYRLYSNLMLFSSSPLLVHRRHLEVVTELYIPSGEFSEDKSQMKYSVEAIMS